MLSKDQIKAELRRCAVTADVPHSYDAWIEVIYWCDWPRVKTRHAKDCDYQTFLLLVAEAL